MQPREIIQFGAFGFDPRARILLKDGEPVRLTRKAAETLLVLIQQSPNVVSKDELVAAVWPGQAVDEHNLTQSISTVRRVLGLQAGQPGFIETFPGRGYRILGPMLLGHAPASTIKEFFSGQPAPAAQPEPSPETAPPAVAGRASILKNPLLWGVAATVLLVVAVLVIVELSARMAANRPAALQVVPLSRHGGWQYQPEVSPDGRTVAFLWQKESTAAPRIWLQNLDSNTPRPLTEQEGEYSSPVWSPDSRSIACLRFHRSSAELTIIETDTGAERVVGQILPTRFGLPYRHLDWSPDGEWIALDDAPSVGSPLAIYLVNPKTGVRKRISQPDDQILGDVAPRFSPDGRTISFLRMPHRNTHELIVVPRDGGAETMVEATDHEISDQRWLANAPHSPALAFATNRDGAFRIWKTQLAPKSQRAVLASEVYGEYPIQFAAVPGQSSLVYSVLASHRGIWRLATAEDRPTERWKRLIESAGQDASPQYSPDGSRICFRSDRTGNEELWIAQADGSGAFPITGGQVQPSVPRWAPDSRSVVFNIDNLDLLVAAEQNSKWSVSSLRAKGVHPVFSPDGKWIYAGTDHAIVRYPAAGGTPVTIAPIRGLSLDVSPDGKTVFFVRQTSDVHLWALDVATGQTSQLIDNLVPYCSSCWAPAAEGVYYLGSERGSFNRQAIFFHEFRSSRERLIEPYPEPVMPIGIGPFSLSPDGRYLLTVRIDPSPTGLLRAQPFR